jgi:predicted metalloprotease with PDZ domain
MEYELNFGRPNTHLLEITIRASGLRGPTAEFAMPAWAPGWYVINDYAKMVQEFSASDSSGRALPWRKTDKQTWSVTLGPNTSAVVKYRLYGNTLSVDWTQFNDRHAHIAGPATWMYLAGGKERPVRLRIAVPAGWRVATGMQRAGENTFTAPDYDTFIDAPLEIADFAEKTFEAGGATFHVIVHDVLEKRDFSQFVTDLRRVTSELIRLMAPAVGGPRAAPFDQYWFLFHLWPDTGGGLEHLNSTQIFLSTNWAEPNGDGYLEQLWLAAHEFFHAWNVKRLRPHPLGPFDYTREVHTPSLWISEGLTSYYASLALLRTGFVTPEKYLENLGNQITFFEGQPGRRERSIEQTSFDTWFWYTTEGPAQTNKANTDHSYYTGGQILGHVLDFTIRHATSNQMTLDDWMRLLYTRHALPRPGFEPDDAVRAASEIAGRDLSDFFRRLLSGKEIPPYEDVFAYAGIVTEKSRNTSRGWLGAQIGQSEEGAPVFGALVPEGPAELAGLDRGDTITAADGQNVNTQQFFDLLRAKRPGDVLTLLVMHLGEQREVSVTLGSDPRLTYTFRRAGNLSASQKRVFESWASGK